MIMGKLAFCVITAEEEKSLHSEQLSEAKKQVAYSSEFVWTVVA